MSTKTKDVIVINFREHDGSYGIPLDTTSRSQSDFSPFLLGPCKLYDGFISKNVENGWQFAKVYSQHWDEKRDRPRSSYWDWAEKGWSDSYAHRYPMGKGAVPVCSWWKGEKLGYIEARKRIYIPLYKRAARKTEAWKSLRELHSRGVTLVLLDFDGYDHKKQGMTLADVLNNPKRPMGHAFVLAMMLKYGDHFKVEEVG